MNRLFVASALIITFAATSLANVPDVRFASGRSARDIPFKIFNNHIYLGVRVNDGQPLRFLLDTGAVNIINLRHARPLGLQLTPAGHAIGNGEGSADVFTAGNISFSLPGVTVSNQKFSVLSLENVEECLNKIDADLLGQITWHTRAAIDQLQMDGVLGFEFFKLFVVEINYVTKTINLYEPESYRYEGDGEKIPFEIDGNHIYMRGSISASTQSNLTGRFLIDTGSAAALVLTSPFVDQTKLLPPADQTTPFPICGIGGDSQTQVGKVSEIRLGKIRVENPVTMFSQAKNGMLASSDYSGNIGNAILRRFKVVFDYSRKLMILERVNRS